MIRSDNYSLGQDTVAFDVASERAGGLEYLCEPTADEIILLSIRFGTLKRDCLKINPLRTFNRRTLEKLNVLIIAIMKQTYRSPAYSGRTEAAHRLILNLAARINEDLLPAYLQVRLRRIDEERQYKIEWIQRQSIFSEWEEIYVEFPTTFEMITYRPLPVKPCAKT